MMLPSDCLALLVQEEPMGRSPSSVRSAHTGCATLGPLASAQHVRELLRSQRPSFALLDGSMGEPRLRPVAKQLSERGVPFALLTLGVAEDAFNGATLWRVAPRLARFLHPPTLYGTVRSLHQADLCSRLAETDRRIEEAQRRLARQLRLAESLDVAGVDNATATALAREIARATRTMRASRAILARQLAVEAGGVN